MSAPSSTPGAGRRSGSKPASSASPRFALADTTIDAATLRAALADDRAGAIAVFEGTIRNHNAARAVSGLRYDSYVELARVEGEAIVDGALRRFDIIEARCTHRIGEVGIGGMAIWAGVSAAHRDAAFAACRWIVDEVKARVPIWKHERYVDGDAGWLHPQGDVGDGAASSGNPAG